MGLHAHSHFVPSGALIFSINDTIAVIESKLKPPIAYWKFNDSPDSSINGITGVWTGTPVYTSSEIDKSATLDGTKYITLDKPELFNFTHLSTFTLIVLCKHTSTAAMTLLGKTNALFSSVGWSFGVRSADQMLRFSLEDSTGDLDVRDTSTALNDGILHMAAASYAGTNTVSGMKIYVDGEPGTLATVANTPLTDITNAYNLMIGTQNNLGNKYNGDIEEIIIFDYVLTDEEIKRVWLSYDYHAYDSPQKQLGMVRSAASTVGLIEAINKVGGLLKNISTSIIGIIESNNLGLRKTISSTVGLNESFNRLRNLVRFGNDIVGLIEQTGRGLRKIIQSTVGLLESNNKVGGIIRNVATDIVGLVENAFEFRRIVFGNDIVGLNDTLNKVGGFLRNITSVVGLTESNNRARDIVRIFNELVGLIEIATAGHRLKVTINEILGIFENSISKRKLFNINDIVNLTENISRNLSYVRVLNNTIGITESSFKLFVGIIKNGVNLFNRGVNIILPTRGGNVILYNRQKDSKTPDFTKSTKSTNTGGKVKLTPRTGNISASNRKSGIKTPDISKNVSQGNKEDNVKLYDKSKSTKLYNREDDVDSMVEND